MPFGLAKNTKIVFLIYTLQIQLRNIATLSGKKKLAGFDFFLFPGRLRSHTLASRRESFVSAGAISQSTARCQRAQSAQHFPGPRNPACKEDKLDFSGRRFPDPRGQVRRPQSPLGGLHG